MEKENAKNPVNKENELNGEDIGTNYGRFG